jgi:tetratricopeptide (TPR) repeat protein
MADIEGILRSSVFWKREVPVAPMMERALGYTGDRRFVAFHWSARLKSLCWADSPFGCARSRSQIWDKFLAHPAVVPHLQRLRSDQKRVERIRFVAKDQRNLDVDNLSKEEEERAKEEAGNAIFLDRQERQLYVARWWDAFSFLHLVYMYEDLGGDEKDMAACEYAAVQGVDWDDEPVPADPAVEQDFLNWLDELLNNPDALDLTAAVHGEFGQFREASKWLRRAVKLAPESARFYYRLTLVYWYLDDWRKALEACDQAIRLRLDRSSERHGYTREELFRFRGRILVRLKRYAEAIDAYRRVLRLKPNYADAYREMGQCWMKLGQPVQAVNAHEHEVQLRMTEWRNSSSDEQRDELLTAFALLGRAYSSNGQDREALWAAEQVAKHHPEGAKWQSKLAEARERLEESYTDS